MQTWEFCVNEMIRQAVYFYRVALLGGDYLGFFSWFFQQRYNTKSWGFLRCDQCVLALNLSYQTPPYDDLHFSVYNGCLRIFGPLVEGVKNKFSKYFQFSYDKRHIKPTAPEKARNSPPPLLQHSLQPMAKGHNKHAWNCYAT